MSHELARKIVVTAARSEPLDVPDLTDNAALRGWLTDRASDYGLRWLLAHADDGVIWGRFYETDRLITSHDAAPDLCRELRAVTLQQARLFSPRAEILLWRDESDWRARVVRDGAPGTGQARWTECYDERQMLWGDRATALGNEFTLWEEGARGLRQALPCPLPAPPPDRPAPPRLVIRHYLTTGDIAGVELSRLCDLSPEDGS